MADSPHDLIVTCFQEFGAPTRSVDLTDAISSRPTLSVLIKKSNMIFRAGRCPGSKTRWKSVAVEYEAKISGGLTAPKIVDRIKRLRHWSTLFLLLEIQREFGKRSPEKWRLIVLRGEWLKETVIQIGGKTMVRLESVYDFEKIIANDK